MPWPFSGKTKITGFSPAQEAEILAVLQKAYDGSSTARTMFHNWIDKDAGNTIDIKFEPGTLTSTLSSGEVLMDFAVFKNASYISSNGTAVKDTLLTALIHELGHALPGYEDNYTEVDYKGDNVKFVNQIYKELGVPEQVSYIAYDIDGTFHKLNYKYTNGAAIDAARTYSESRDTNMSSAKLGVSKDLLIGGPLDDTLQSSQGNDFLFGAGGNDELNGGTGKDTGVYFGTPLDYDIRRNSEDGSWSVRNVRGAKDAGSDTLKGVEVVQFDNGKTYNLKKAGLTFQTDLAFVIDTTGSMTPSIGGVKAKASEIINAVFAGDGKDGRIGVVGFKDNTIGEKTQVILPFTDQDDFEARKSAAVAAINGISVTGGGDLPETSFDGLRVALDGSMGQWRFGAGVLRVVLFTDAEAKDGFLKPRVEALASSIGATIEKHELRAGSDGSVDTFSLAFGGDESGDSVDTFSPAFGGDGSGDSVDTFSPAFGGDGSSSAQRSQVDDFNANPPFPFVPSDDPIPPDPTTAQIQIFTIFTGSSGLDTSDFEGIADTTGGRFFRSTTGDDVVDTLLNIINLPLTGENTPPTAVNDTLTTNQTIAVSINVLANDSDPNGDVITIETFDAVSTGGGNVVLDNRGTPDNLTDDRLLYTPLATFNGSDSFTYTISDGTDTATASVVVEVGVNLDGSNGPDELTGTPGDDRLNGSNGKDTLTGLAANDTLSGDNGDDILNGGAGVDQLAGDLGSDILTGGSEADTFVFAEKGNSLMDKITDLVIGTDIIDGFSAVTATNIAKVGAVSFLTSRGIGAKLTNSTFGANGAAIFTLDSDPILTLDGDDILTRETGVDEFAGDLESDILTLDGDDILTRETGVDELAGDLESDILTLDGDDILTGEAGVDELAGDLGSDILTEGSEADTFVSVENGNSLTDTITDSVSGTDIIDDFSAVTATNIAKVGEVSSLTDGGIAAKPTYSTFSAAIGASTFSAAIGASTFSAAIGTAISPVKTASTRTFLALNDGNAGFSLNNDILIEITGYSGDLNSLAIV
jgi:Ca2+-binding RTX toxin-like protein